MAQDIVRHQEETLRIPLDDACALVLLDNACANPLEKKLVALMGIYVDFYSTKHIYIAINGPRHYPNHIAEVLPSLLY